MYDASDVKQHIAQNELKKLQEVDQVSLSSWSLCFCFIPCALTRSSWKWKGFLTALLNKHGLIAPVIACVYNYPQSVFLAILKVLPQ